MSPIYVRPEREQAEHDRLIRHLQSKYGRKFEVAINPGDERIAPVKVATITHFPDLVLNQDKRLAGLVEIETAASVNNLETMAKWVPFSRARVPFHLYVPVQGYEAALRLAEAHQVKAAEIWTYRPANDGFDLVRMFVDATIAARMAKSASKPPAAKATKSRPASKPSKVSKPAKRESAAKRKPPAAKAAPRRPAKPKSAPSAKGKAKTKAKAKKGTGARKGR